MNQLSGVLLHMNLMDSHRLFSLGSLNVHMPVSANRQIKLADLIILRVVWIKIIFPVKLTVLCNRAVGGKPDCHRSIYHLLIQHRKRTRHPCADRAGMGIRRPAKRRGTAAEYFRLCRKLHMNFQTNHSLILFCHFLTPHFLSSYEHNPHF